MIRRFIAWLRGSPVKPIFDDRPYTSREKRSVAASIMSATEPRGRTWA